MKKILSVFLAVMMLITSVPFTSLGVSSNDPLSLPKSIYGVGEAIIPKVYPVGSANGSWVGLFLASDTEYEWVHSFTWIYTSDFTSSTNFLEGESPWNSYVNNIPESNSDARSDFYSYFSNGALVPGEYKLVYFQDSGYTEIDTEYFTVVGNSGGGVTGEQFPAGYDFKEDSYSFSNFSGNISKDYYTTMFGEQKGTELFEFRGSKTGGHCYGMSLTTAATFLGVPEATDYIKYNLDFHKNLRSVNKGSISYTMGISAKDYIKYAHIYQDSVSGTINRRSNENDISGLKQAVRNFVNGVGSPVLIDLLGGPGWHTVLAIGVDGEDIIVNDSNVTSKYMTIDFDESGEWSYSAAGHSWNNTNTKLSYSTDVVTPYMRIVARIHVEGANVPKDENSEISGETDFYATGMDIVDENYILVVDDTNSCSFDQKEEMVVLDEYTTGNNGIGENDASLYWISNNNIITAENTSTESAELKVVDNDIKISAILPKNSSAEFSMDNNNVIVESKKDVDVSVMFTTIDNSGDLVDAIISGTSNGTEITATQTETGLLVTGISDGTVTLSKDDEVIATQEIKDAESDIEITYDTDGSSDDLDIEYHSHSYTSKETKTATCKEKGEMTYTCSCEDTYTEEIPVNPDNHIGKTEVRNSSESTCEKNGYTGDIYCLDCGEKILEGESKELLDHNYNADGICEMCGKDRTENCTHMCHKTGFMGIIWKILRFFYKLFGSNPVCQCGVKHY